MRRWIWLVVFLVGCSVPEGRTLDGTSKEAWQASIKTAMAEMTEDEKTRFQGALLKVSIEKTQEGKTNEEILKELDGISVNELINE